MGDPQELDGLFHGKSHREMDDDWGYPYFKQTPYDVHVHAGWWKTSHIFLWSWWARVGLGGLSTFMFMCTTLERWQSRDHSLEWLFIFIVDLGKNLACTAGWGAPLDHRGQGIQDLLLQLLGGPKPALWAHTGGTIAHGRKSKIPHNATKHSY